MARIAGIDIPDEKRIDVSLTYIFGIGRSLANEILEQARVDSSKKAGELEVEEINRIRSIIDGTYKIEGELKTQSFSLLIF